MLNTGDKILRLFSCETLHFLLWPITFDVCHRVPVCRRGSLLSKQAPTPRLCSPFPAHCSGEKRAREQRSGETIAPWGDVRALGAARWMMIWAHWCCCFSLCWMLTHGPLWLGVDPLCGQDPGGCGGKGWVGCNEPSLDCWARVCRSRFCVYVCVSLHVSFSMPPWVRGALLLCSLLVDIKGLL